MARQRNNKMPQASVPTPLKVEDSNDDEAIVDDSTKTPENHGGKKAKLCLKLTEVESLLFFNMIRFNNRPDAIDWDQVAEHSGLKPKSVRVRFRQILKKHGLTDLVGNPNKTSTEVGGQRRGKRPKNEASGVVAASQDDDDGQSVISPERQGPGTGDSQLAVPETQTAVPRTKSHTPDSQHALPTFPPQSQTPQFGDGVKPETARSSPGVNDPGFSRLFAPLGPQQQQQQQLPTDTKDDPAKIGPSDPFFDPSVPLAMAPIGVSANGGTTLSTAFTAKQPHERQEQVINEQVMQPFSQFDNAGGFQQMGNWDNVGNMAGMGVSPSGQSAQTNNNQYGTSTHDTKRYIKFKFVDNPMPYVGDPNFQVNYSEGHGKWRVEATMPMDLDLDSDYDI